MRGNKGGLWLGVMLRSCAWCGCYYLSMVAGTRRFYNQQQHGLSSVVSTAVNRLIHHPALVEWNDIDSINGHKSNARKKLKPIHSTLFDTSTVFDRFAKIVCNTGVMPTKELFETWSAALYIDQHFATNRRIADVAAGHGLLAWSLLVLDEERRSDLQGDDNDLPPPRTVGTTPFIDLFYSLFTHVWFIKNYSWHHHFVSF